MVGNYSLIVYFRHEGRSWYTPHRGRVWIAATAKVPEPEEIVEVEQQYRYLLKGDKIATHV